MEELSQFDGNLASVAQITQQNSATAEESAAASEEMSAQSVSLENLINQFLEGRKEVAPEGSVTNDDSTGFTDFNDSDVLF